MDMSMMAGKICREQCNGVEYTTLDLDVAYSPLDNKPADHSPGLNAELSEISIKKNSPSVQFQNISIPTLRLTCLFRKLPAGY